jgi:hypothetical protein
MEEWSDEKTRDILFFWILSFPNIPIFHHSSIPMFDALSCGYAALGSLWLDGVQRGRPKWTSLKNM